ncbi:hypothetical protein D3C78_1530770 [compost metagenome]
MDLPFSEAAVGCRLLPLRATNRAGALDTLSEKAICAWRCGVMVIDEAIASNFFASNPGIIPSQLLSTQTHLACI